MIRIFISWGGGNLDISVSDKDICIMGSHWGSGNMELKEDLVHYSMFFIITCM